MDKNYEFKSITEVELFELKNPGVLNSDPDANEAARGVFKAALSDKRKVFARIPQDIIDSMSLNQIDGNLTEILSIEDWLSKHPAIIKTSDVIDTAHDEDLKKLAHTKKMLALSLRAIPGSIAFNESSNFIRKIAEIEQKLGMYPAI